MFPTRDLFASSTYELIHVGSPTIVIQTGTLETNSKFRDQCSGIPTNQGSSNCTPSGLKRYERLNRYLSVSVRSWHLDTGELQEHEGVTIAVPHRRVT